MSLCRLMKKPWGALQWSVQSSTRSVCSCNYCFESRWNSLILLVPFRCFSILNEIRKVPNPCGLSENGSSQPPTLLTWASQDRKCIEEEGKNEVLQDRDTTNHSDLTFADLALDIHRSRARDPPNSNGWEGGNLPPQGSSRRLFAERLPRPRTKNSCTTKSNAFVATLLATAEGVMNAFLHSRFGHVWSKGTFEKLIGCVYLTFACSSKVIKVLCISQSRFDHFRNCLFRHISWTTLSAGTQLDVFLNFNR